MPSTGWGRWRGSSPRVAVDATPILGGPMPRPAHLALHACVIVGASRREKSERLEQP